ncbi:MAG: S41 family peptidase [Phycisphaerales bacterium]|nr:S41 family peptidase [Phycisphaerales bacterium]
MNIRQILPPILLIALTAILAVQIPSAIAGRATNYDWFGPIIDTRAILMDRYVDDPDDAAMQEAILTAMVEALDDPHTVYVPPVEESDFTKDLMGHYVGIGAHVRPAERRLTIVSPMDGSPALEAGIKAGDLVLKVDDFDTLDQPTDKIIDQLLGEPGTQVTLLVRHRDGSEEEIVVTRRPINAPTTYGFMRRDGQWRYMVDPERGIAYLRLAQFTDQTVNQVIEAMQRATNEGPVQALVLDLRNNPGGALQAAVAMSDLFLAEGDIVSVGTERPGRSAERRTRSARPGQLLEDIEVVVLIDQNSASASEIVAGAIKDNDRGRIIGKRSFGKGSVQEVRPLDDEMGLLKFTTAYYYLPSGRNLHRRQDQPEAPWGVDPSTGCVVPETPEARRLRLEAQRSFEIITDEEPVIEGTIDQQWLREAYQDPAMAEALDLLQHRIDTQTWPELAEDQDAAFPPMQAELDIAMDQREAMYRHLIELEGRIAELEGSEETTARGLVGLPEDFLISGARLILQNPDGSTIGHWDIAEGENIRASLEAVELIPVSIETTTESEDPNAD